MSIWRRVTGLIHHLLLRYWVMVGWVLLSTCMFLSAFRFYQTEPRFHYLRSILGAGLCISRGSAAVLNLSCLVALLPMCRAIVRLVCNPLPHTLTQPLTDCPKTCHLVVIYTIIVASVIHTCSHFSNAYHYSKFYNFDFPELNAAKFLGQNPAIILLTSFAGFTGVMMLALLLVLGITSMTFVRRRCYEVFQYSHYLALPFLLILVVHPFGGILKQQLNTDEHPPGCVYNSTYKAPGHLPRKIGLEEVELNLIKKQVISSTFYSNELTIHRKSNHNEKNTSTPYNDKIILNICKAPPIFTSIKSRTWIWVGVALLVWVLERVLRWWSSRKEAVIMSVQSFPCDIIQLKLYKLNFKFSPGQFILLNCPEISEHEWHPFTIAFMEGEGLFSIFIQTKGDWGKSLVDLLKKRGIPSVKHISEVIECSEKSEDFQVKCLKDINSSIYSNKDSNFFLKLSNKENANDCTITEIIIDNNNCIKSSSENSTSNNSVKTIPISDHYLNISEKSDNIKSDLTPHYSYNDDPNLVLSYSLPDIRLQVTGPYCSPHETLDTYQVVIGIAGGIGITPLIAALSKIISKENIQRKRIHLIWVVRNPHQILPFASKLTTFIQDCWNLCVEDKFELKVHITGEVPARLHDVLDKYFSLILSRTHPGRPNWQNLFKQWKETYKRVNVGIFVCGPKPLSHQIRKLCLQSATQGYRFSFNHESF